MNSKDKVNTFLFIHHNDANWLSIRATFHESLTALIRKDMVFLLFRIYSSNISAILASLYI